VAAAVDLAELVARFGGLLQGDGATRVVGIAALDHAGPGEITFLTNPKYRDRLAQTRAAAVILAAESAPQCPVPCIVAEQPYLYFARVAQYFNPPPQPGRGIDPDAVVRAHVPASVSVGPGAVVEEGAVIGEDAVIGPACVIAGGVVIGAAARLHARVTIYPGCHIGRRVIIHSGAVLGADGFGFAREADGSWVKIPQVGGVLIGDDVEIGANTTIDRGALEDTVIGDGVKLDNQIQVAHNVHIGAHSAIAGCVGIAGSTHIGRRCTIGGAAMIIGHLEITDDVHISAGTLISKSIPRSGSYTGSVPFLAHAEWLKNFSRLRHLDTMADKIRALETQVASLVAASEKKPS
jgi:UDP-3-O-[3-hydroxymyristoyl] glucosamine N-acyltransferase